MTTLNLEGPHTSCTSRAEGPGLPRFLNSLKNPNRSGRAAFRTKRDPRIGTENGIEPVPRTVRCTEWPSGGNSTRSLRGSPPSHGYSKVKGVPGNRGALRLFVSAHHSKAAQW